MQEQLEQKDRALFNKIASEYAKKDYFKSTSMARRYQLLYAIKPILDRLKIVDTIVEIACGVGASALYLKGLYKNYVGIDYSQELVEAARVFNSNNPNARFVISNIKLVQLQKHIGDIILAVGALHHMTELDKVMHSINDIAKPGGYFVAIEPQSGNPAVQIMRWLRTKIDRSYSIDQQFFSKNELYDLMDNNGMTEIEIEYQGYFSPPFAQVIIPPQILTIPLSRLAIYLDGLLDKHLPGILKSLSWNIVIRAKFSQ